MTDILLGSANPRISRAGETGVTRVCVDVSAWVAEYPDGAGALVFKRPDGQTYPLTTTHESGLLRAVLTATETAVSGPARIEAQWLDNGKVAKSRVFDGRIAASLGEAGTTPSSTPSWVDAMTALGAAVGADAAQVAADKATVAADAAQVAADKASAAGSAADAQAARVAAEQSAMAAQSAATGAQNSVAAHTSDTNNPHAVTAEQVHAVSYEEAQALTDTQKTQARGNIDVAQDVVRYDTDQAALTDNQREKVRNKINAQRNLLTHLSPVNLYITQTLENSYDRKMIFSSGNLGDNQNYFVTSYIPVLPNTAYVLTPAYFTESLAQANRMRCYDAGGTALAVVSSTLTASGNLTFTTPANTATVRFSVVRQYAASNNPSLTETLLLKLNSTVMLIRGTESDIPSEYVAWFSEHDEMSGAMLGDDTVDINAITGNARNVFLGAKGKNVVNFGDSIYGENRPPQDISSAIAKLTGAACYNAAFGGTSWSQYAGTHFDAFCMYQLAYSIANNDWTIQNDALNYSDRTSYAEIPLATLKSLDFSKMGIATLAFGTNDWGFNKTLDNTENRIDTTTMAGGMRYTIETLMTAYPRLRMIILSPIRRYNTGMPYTERAANTLGLYLKEYVAKVKQVAEEYGLEYVDMYNIGITGYNASIYLPDGAHPTYYGVQRIAKKVACVLNSQI